MSSSINIITATEALSSGLSLSAFFSIARFNERLGDNVTGQAARRVGRDLARLMGMDLGGRRRAANNNRPRSDRRAA
ncbi:hypothetical protein LB517_27945 [Mesorhizobium sp. BR1-1-12]|uniref:hypothetical protein n=1 Tax=Mesorhizobium sp. BR1-1-12 TaxID=2876657 RepID=UPI001CD16257|nr:hypothetical protein [Mesorhizobium sp. BR1-1-12]MBZ9973466.1 hypothetical protein [Mesorhizobium sp. BR1-1-12]